MDSLFFPIFAPLISLMMMFQNDIMLLQTMRNGDKASFDRLFLKYYPALCAYSGQFVGVEQGEDIVQAVMVGLWEKRHLLEINTSLKSYLFISVRNKCLTAQTTAQRQNRILQTIHQNVAHETENPDFYDIHALSCTIEEALAKLPESYRKVFMMNRFEDKTYQQIAVELNISAKTVDYRICQSLKILRKELKEFLPLLLLGLL